MHEMSVTSSLVEKTIKLAQDYGAQKVTSVTLAIGDLSGFDAESLKFCFSILTRGTLLENAELIVEKEGVEIFCTNCQKSTLSCPVYYLVCSHCGSSDVEVRKGKSFIIKSMEID